MDFKKMYETLESNLNNQKHFTEYEACMSTLKSVNFRVFYGEVMSHFPFF